MWTVPNQSRHSTEMPLWYFLCLSTTKKKSTGKPNVLWHKRQSGSKQPRFVDLSSPMQENEAQINDRVLWNSTASLPARSSKPLTGSHFCCCSWRGWTSFLFCGLWGLQCQKGVKSQPDHLCLTRRTQNYFQGWLHCPPMWQTTRKCFETVNIFREVRLMSEISKKRLPKIDRTPSGTEKK